VVLTGLQVLPEGQHFTLVLSQLLQNGENLILLLTQSEHQARFGGYSRLLLFELLEQLQ
jgi:hypothetical protein